MATWINEDKKTIAFTEWANSIRIWFDDEYKLWNIPDWEVEEWRNEHPYFPKDQFRFTTSELFNIWNQLEESQPPPPVSEDVKEAAKQYCDKIVPLPDKPIHVNIKHVREDVYDAFLAGATHGQQVFAGYPSKGGILSKKLGVESHKVLDEEKRQSVFAAMDEYAFYYHDEKLKSSSQPLPSNIAEALEKLNPQNSDGTDTKWYEYYGSQVQGEGKESFVHSATCYLACKMAEQELFQKIKELLSVQPVQGNAEDQEALWNEIKSKFFLTNMLNPKWTEEFIQQYTIKKK